MHVDYQIQKVTVWGICNKDDVLATIRKKRREACFWDQLETEVKNKVAQEEAEGAENAPHPATVNMHKKSWKKLFPLVLHQ